MNFLKNLKKKTALLALFVSVILGGAFVAASGYAANTVPMEGDVTSLNATKGETVYTKSTDLMVDEVAQVQLWHHNLKAPGTDVANNTVVKFDVPSEAGSTQVVRGTSSSDNGNTISDTTTINLSLDKASLQYVQGSAKFKYNKGAVDGREECITGYEYPAADCFALVSIPDTVVTTGVNLDNYRGGPLEGCNAYHETVIIQVRSVASSLKVNKYVRHLGETTDDWKTHMNAEPGDDLEYMIRFENKGNVQLENVSVGDNLPRYHDYTEGSTKLMNGTYPNGTSISSDNVISGGIYVGNYNPGAVGYVLIRTKIDPVTAFEFCGDYELTNTALVGADNNNTVYNTTKVTVTVDDSNCVEEPEEPIYSCDALKIFKVDRDTFRFTITATAENGATIESYDINTGTETITSDVATVEYTYSKAGTYNVKASVVVKVNGETKTDTSENCEGQLTVDEPEEPIYRCENLKATLISGRKYRFTVDATAEGGATIKHYVYDFGDDNEVTTDKATVEHTYAKDGEYPVFVTVVFNVNNELRSDECSAIVKVKETPKTPEELPNTGAGSLVGLMAATTFLGALGYRFALLRR